MRSQCERVSCTPCEMASVGPAHRIILPKKKKKKGDAAASRGGSVNAGLSPVAGCCHRGGSSCDSVWCVIRYSDPDVNLSSLQSLPFS